MKAEEPGRQGAEDKRYRIPGSEQALGPEASPATKDECETARPAAP